MMRSCLYLSYAQFPNPTKTVPCFKAPKHRGSKLPTRVLRVLLFRVQLDDEMLFHWEVDIITTWQSNHRSLKGVCFAL